MSHSMPASSRTPCAAVGGADAGGVLEGAPLVQPVGHRQRLAVIGDGDVLEAAGPRRRGHRPRCRPCRRSRSCACEGRRAGRRDRPGGEAPGHRSVDLAPILAQLGRDPLEAERFVDAFLCLAGDFLVAFDAEQAVLVQLEAQADRAVAQGDVVGLRAGEVLQRGAAAVGRARAGGRPGTRRAAARSTWCRRRASTRSTRRYSTNVVHQRRVQRRRRGCRCRRRSRSRAAGCPPASIGASGACSRRASRRAPRRRRARPAADAGRRGACARQAP